MTAQEKMTEIKQNVGSVHDPEILFAINQLYRELEININDTPLFSYHVHKLINAGHPARCKCCNSEQNLTYDHIIPKAHGGGRNIKNGQILCLRCNSIKADRMISIEELREEIKK